MSTPDFFPPGIFGPDDSGYLSRFAPRNWYEARLQELGEPSLYAQRHGASWRTARFLWLRTFHFPLVARLDSDASGQAIAYASTSPGALSCPPDFELSEDATLIPQPQVSEFWNLLSEASFWDLPSQDEAPTYERDGAQWILEVLEGGCYHLVERRSPPDGPFHRAALCLLELAGVSVRHIY